MSNAKTFQATSFVPSCGITSLSSVSPLLSLLHPVITWFISPHVHTSNTRDDLSRPHTSTRLQSGASLQFPQRSPFIHHVSPPSAAPHPCCRYSLHSWCLDRLSFRSPLSLSCYNLVSRSHAAQESLCWSRTMIAWGFVLWLWLTKWLKHMHQPM